MSASDDQNLHIFYGYVLGCVRATQATKLSSERYRIVVKGQGGQIMLLSGFEPVKVHYFFICFTIVNFAPTLTFYLGSDLVVVIHFVKPQSPFTLLKIVFYRYFLMNVHHHDVYRTYKMYLILVT